MGRSGGHLTQQMKMAMAIRPGFLPLSAIAATFLCSTQALAEAEPATPNQIVSALEATFGTHPGQRRNHIKGTCATGEFIGLPEASAYTRSRLFSGRALPVTARFSLPGGNPAASDATRSPRGMALEIKLEDGGLHHMTMLNTPMFGASTPETFLADILARQPDPATGKPDPRKVQAFRDAHPDSIPLYEFLQQHNPPPAWTNSSYFGVHTFKFVDLRGAVTLVRWRFKPHDGEKEITSAELKSLPQNFLEKRLVERIARGPARWDMILTIGEPGDPENDPTKLWPTTRKEIKVGTLSITSVAPLSDASCNRINFDPLVLSDGIQPTNDPVLRARSPAYAISFGKRIAGQ